MPCDTRLRQGQSISSRKAEVRKVVDTLSRKLATGSAKAKLSPKGGIAFEGLTESERDGVTDACAYRMVMVHGSALAKMAISKAEFISGRKVVAHGGEHSHDGGNTWHDPHKH